MTGWWATAARALALIVALAVALPAAGLAEDYLYHQGRPGHDRIEVNAVSDLLVDGMQTADPGLACHVHCGCHVAATLNETASAPPVGAFHPNYALVSAAVPSVFPDRLPRPPRA